MEITQVFVAGTGLMGTGIAQQAAASGFDVIACDISQPQLDRARASIEKSLAKLAEKGRLSEADASATLERIAFVNSDYSGIARAHLLIEAITEDEGQKQAFYARAWEVGPAEGAIWASNTSSIPITRLARFAGRTESFCGMHFFNPVPLMPLVELIRGVDTSDLTAAAVASVAEKMGKTVVNAPDLPGFVVNRMLTMLMSEAFQLALEGVRPEDIDAGAKLGLNHPMGPLELADFVGLDTMLSVFEVLYAGFGNPRYAAPPALRQLVEAGHLGRKSGRGFYSYDK
ncbi:MAG: 3-hydroxyacyl-CoA dehydrogenase family protein [Candidatus Dormibacteria bacterium]